MVVRGVRAAGDRDAAIPAGRRLGDEEVQRVGTAEHSHRAFPLRPGMDHRALLRAHDCAADRAAHRPAALEFAVDKWTRHVGRGARARHDRSRFRKVQRPAAGQDRRAAGAAPGAHARRPRRAAHERCGLERGHDAAGADRQTCRRRWQRGAAIRAGAAAIPGQRRRGGRARSRLGQRSVRRRQRPVVADAACGRRHDLPRQRRQPRSQGSSTGAVRDARRRALQPHRPAARARINRCGWK